MQHTVRITPLDYDVVVLDPDKVGLDSIALAEAVPHCPVVPWTSQRTPIVADSRSPQSTCAARGRRACVDMPEASAGRCLAIMRATKSARFSSGVPSGSIDSTPLRHSSSVMRRGPSVTRRTRRRRRVRLGTRTSYVFASPATRFVAVRHDAGLTHGSDRHHRCWKMTQLTHYLPSRRR